MPGFLGGLTPCIFAFAYLCIEFSGGNETVSEHLTDELYNNKSKYDRKTKRQGRSRCHPRTYFTGYSHEKKRD